jgi:proteasome accessory factor C
LNAISSRKNLQISYHSLIRDELTNREITPIELMVDHGYEVLQAYCHFADAYRTFRLDNIIDAIVSNEDSQQDISLRDEIDLQMEISISARLRTTLERFRILVEPGVALVTQRFTAKSFSQDWLIRNAMSTLEVTEVLSPISSRSEVALRCRKTLDLYQSPIFSKSS